MKLKLFGLICCAIVLLILGLFHFIPVSRIFAVQAAMHEMPLDNTGLVDWLADQPGVVERTVHVQHSTDGTVTVTFLMSQNAFNFPPFPDLEAKCLELGYKFKSPKFIDGSVKHFRVGQLEPQLMRGFRRDLSIA